MFCYEKINCDFVCECGSNEFCLSDQVYCKYGLAEYKIYCAKCYQYIGEYAYGNWLKFDLLGNEYPYCPEGDLL